MRSASMDISTVFGASGYFPRIDWLPRTIMVWDWVIAPAARIGCSRLFLFTEDPPSFRGCDESCKRARRSEQDGLFIQPFEHGHDVFQILLEDRVPRFHAGWWIPVSGPPANEIAPCLAKDRIRLGQQSVAHDGVEGDRAAIAGGEWFLRVAQGLGA